MQQFYLRNKHRSFFAYGMLLLVCIAGFWPLSFGVFSLKNDAVHYFLPFRYNISCAIRAGELPLWSPFIYMGYPVHGDMQSGAWNPFVWIFSFFTTYNMSVLQWETLLYYFLSGAGMYKLSGLYTGSRRGRFYAATAYMLGGYMFGSGQFINWVASAAFVPFTVYYYLRFLKDPIKGYAIKMAIAGWLLLVCGYPADMVFTVYLLAGITVVAWLRALKKRLPISYLPFLQYMLLSALIFIAVSAPALLSFYELLPYYERGDGISLDTALQNSLAPENLVSLVNPWVVQSPDFHSSTDPTARNLFMGVLLPLLLLPAWFFRKGFLFRLTWSIGLLSLLFSFGEGFLLRGLAYHVLPVMDSFRHPAHFRLYFMAAVLLVTAPLPGEATASFLKKWSLTGVAIISLAAITLLLFFAQQNDTRTGFYFPSTDAAALKKWLDNFNTFQAAASGLLLLFIFLGAYWICLQRKNRVRHIVVVNIVSLVAFNALLPVTLVSKTAPASINRFIDAQPAGPDAAALVKNTIAENSMDATSQYEKLGLLYFYNKRIALSNISYSPSFLEHQLRFLQDSSLKAYTMKRPVLYFSSGFRAYDELPALLGDSCHYSIVDKPTGDAICTGTPASMEVERFGYNQVRVRTINPEPALLQLAQNWHHNWTAFVDGKRMPVYRVHEAFMAVPVPAGRHVVTWNYNSGEIRTSAYISIAVLPAIFLWGCLHHYYRKRRARKMKDTPGK